MKNLFKNLMKKTAVAALALCLLSTAAVAAESLLINGAGATFPYPLYSKWFAEYHKAHSDIQFNYQSIGSGGGIQQITAKTVDFGATDAPMSSGDMSATDAPLFHIPTTLGAVVVSYNAPISGELKLSGEVIANIYLGKITKWNDPAIAALNSGVTLPATDILVVYRSDGSGTTYVFTDYLTKVSGAWSGKIGTGKSVKWPVGIGAKGNEGVTGMIKQTPGALGYVELNYAIENKLPYASVSNKAGKFIKPTVATVSAAASDVSKIPADYRVSITDSAAAEAYPISSFTYLLVYIKQTDAAKGKALVDFLNWAMTEGQKISPSLNYSPLPEALVAKVQKTISEIKIK